MLKRLAAAGVVTAAMGGVLLTASPALAGGDWGHGHGYGYGHQRGIIIDNDNVNINRPEVDVDVTATEEGLVDALV